MRPKNIKSWLPINYKLILVLCFLCIAVFSAVVFYRIKVQYGEPKSLVVTLTKNGFVPSSIEIQKGQTVKFVTDQNEEFWPASDMHPTHTIYPEFDPKQPIPANSSWSFTFDRAGKWGYHNHLRADQKGTIIVKDSGNAENVACSGQQQCWNEQIETTLKNEGYAAAFALVSQLYKTEPAFAADCHGYLHTLGNAAYDSFANHEEVPIFPEAADCGYGFYHGLMEALLSKSGDISQAKTFCAKVSQATTTVLADACYHGVGHGALQMSVNDPSLWGNEPALVKPALEVCRKVSENDTQASRCASGVFMELSSYYATGQYKLSIDKNNPFSICEQEQSFPMDCYTQSYPLLQSLSGNNLSVAIKFVEKIQSDTYAAEATQTLIGTMAEISKPASVSICQTIQARLKLPCVRGFALAYMLKSKPGDEYKSASNFCRTAKLTNEQRDSCFGLVQLQSQGLYSSEQMREICQDIDPKYRQGACEMIK